MARPKILQPRSLEIAYFRQIDGVLTAQDEAWRTYAGLLPAVNQRQDGLVDELDRYFRAAQVGIDAALNKLQLVQAFANTALFNWRMWGRQVAAGTKFTLPETQPWNEPGIDDIGQEWVTDNVRRIKGFTDERNALLRKAIADGIAKGWSREQLAREILSKDLLAGLSGTHLSARQRADLIATDQILTANADLTMQRMRTARVKYYTWRGMDDARERPEHVQLNDSVLRVDGRMMTDKDLQAVGKPGQLMRTAGAEIAPGRPIRCRCYAEAWFEGSVYDDHDM